MANTAEEVGVEIERVRPIILALDRSLRSQKLYAMNNPILLRHFSELTDSFSQFFTDHEEIEFMVQPFELRVGDEIVYKNENQQESFAFRLFNDGIRTLKFSGGLRSEELHEFVHAINSNADVAEEATDSDAVTLLWEKEFEHIEYTVADSIIDEPNVDDKSTDEKLEEVLDPKMETYQAGEADPEEDIYTEFKVTLNLNSVGSMFQEKTVLSPDELDRIRDDLADSDSPERLALDFVDMVLAVLQEETNSGDFKKYLLSLGQVLDHNLMHGHIHITRMILDQVHHFPNKPIALAPTDPRILEKTLATIWTESRVSLLIQCLNQNIKAFPEDIEEVVAHMSPKSLPYLLKHLTDIEDPGHRKSVALGIARLHKGDLGIFMPMLSSKDLEILQAGLQILSRLDNEKVIDLLPNLVQHQNLQIRKEAIGLLRKYPSAKARRMLLGLLQDSREEIRGLALRVLALHQDPEIARQLMGVLNREDFQDKSLQERKAYFYTVAKIAKDNFVPYLRDILRRKSWFRKAELEDHYQCATFALGVIGTPLAEDVLKEGTRSRNKIIKRLSETVLKRSSNSPAGTEAL